jgi:hypothetical protein
MFTANPEKQIEVEKIAAILRQAPVGGTVTYRQIEAALGREFDRLALMKARQLVEKEDGIRFGTVRKVGVKKLDAAAAIGIGAEARQRIRRIAGHQCARLTGLKYNDITADGQRRLDVERSLLGAISAAAANKSTAKVEPAITTGPEVANRVFQLLQK